MKKLLVSLTSATIVVIATSSQATLLMYEPFDYPAGERLGGSGTSPLGQTNANGMQWIVRSPATTNYTEARDALITAGNLSYPGLSSSVGNSVRYGSSVAQDPTLYTDAIAIPGAPYLTNSIYYSMIVRFHSAVASGGGRTSYAAFSEDPADPQVDAGYGVLTSSGQSNIPLPAGAWIRNSGTTDYHLGAGKANSDGMGPSEEWPSWQSGTASYPNQQGNIAGTGQAYATIEDNTYFIVMKYTYVGFPDGNDDTVSMWINPIASTLGDDAGEVPAGEAGGSYYSATNAYVTANLDATFYGIQSFMLIANAQQSSRTDKTIDVSVDEIRIGTTWADVTPAPAAPPVPPQIISITNAGTTSVTVTWTNVVMGSNYVLQYSTNLADTNWIDLAPVTATGDTASQTDNPPSGDAARLYRVLVQ